MRFSMAARSMARNREQQQRRVLAVTAGRPRGQVLVHGEGVGDVVGDDEHSLAGVQEG